MDAPRGSSVEEAFRPAFQEIARRSAAATSVGDAGRFFSTTDEKLCVDLQTQAHVLVSMSTAVLAPQAVDATRPALRVYGAFPTRDDAVEHAAVVRAVEGRDISFVILRRNEWVLMPARETTRDDPERNAAQLHLLVAAHEQQRRNTNSAFDVRLEAKCEASYRAPALAVADEDDVREAEALVYPSLRRLRAGAEVRGQSAVTLCVLPDVETGECAVRVLGCFESCTQAETWVRNVGSRTVDEDIHVAPTCEWLQPHDVHGGTLHYRHPELQRIMDAADRNVDSVRTYKDMMAEREDAEGPANACAIEECSSTPTEDDNAAVPGIGT